jgi:uncharacterized SAM-binding protein YcdF (DUF218 family)
MFIFLSKALPPLVYPLGLALILILAALWAQRRPRAQRILLTGALLILWLGSTRWVSAAARRGLEWQYLPQGALPTADAIVLLGGGTESQQAPRPTVELNGAGDRVLYAARLYREGRAPYILLSGGLITSIENGASPAADMAALLEFLGVPPQALWLEGDSRNTYENAVYAAQILRQHGVERILLVTSAMHMPRSVALFERQGLEVIPAPTDFTVTEQEWARLVSPNPVDQLFNLLPSASQLNMLSAALKEYLGMFVYRLRGWL